jgi:transposase-like protein
MDTQVSQDVPVALDPAFTGLFEDRYGIGAPARLMALLQQPCVTFAEIADQFGVTRECVRQWHQRLLPDAPTGHERQRLCRQYQRKRELFKDDLFAGFHRRLRAQVPSKRIGLIPARDGFRRRTVRLDDRVIALKRARVHAAHATATVSYRLVNGVGTADFIYYELNATDYLLLPRAVLQAQPTTFVDVEGQACRPFKNTFGALWRSGRWSPE